MSLKDDRIKGLYANRFQARKGKKISKTKEILLRF